jgi:hypothetical protein
MTTVTCLVCESYGKAGEDGTRVHLDATTASARRPGAEQARLRRTWRDLRRRIHASGAARRTECRMSWLLSRPCMRHRRRRPARPVADAHGQPGPDPRDWRQESPAKIRAPAEPAPPHDCERRQELQDGNTAIRTVQKAGTCLSTRPAPTMPAAAAYGNA